MKKRVLCLVLAIAMLLSTAATASAATTKITTKTDKTIQLINGMLAAIDYQNFTGTGKTSSQVKEIIRHFIYDSSFAAIGTGKFPYPNSGSNTKAVKDNKFSASITSSKGCIAYCYFLSKVIYGKEGSRRGEQKYTKSDVNKFKELLQTYGQAGDHIRISGKHSLTFISCTNDGFYTLEYLGDGTQQIALTYWTYSDFVNYYSGYSSIWLYDANTNQNTPTYAITYNANGGAGAPAAQTKVKDKALALSTVKPTRTGYAFLGWSASPTATSAAYKAGGNYTANAAATLYAVWKANTFSVKFDANGGKGSMSNQGFTYGTAKALTANAFKRTNYVFQGWEDRINSSRYTDKQSVSNLTSINEGTVTLYAIWQKIYSVKFSANGGTGTMANQSFVYGTAKGLTANAFTRAGYTFQGWATTASGAVKYTNKQSVSNLSSTAGGTITLYAVWKANNYTVKFNANGGTGTIANQSFAYGTAKALTANAFSRKGYTFQGWATSATGAVKYANKQSVSNLTSTNGGTVTLYAVWKANTYTVKFNANGGSRSMANQSFAYGTAKALTANAFTRAGYTFQGWATTAGGAVKYTNKQAVSNLTSTNGGTVTLYAIWKK